jgi:prevent-host-death family protein
LTISLNLTKLSLLNQLEREAFMRQLNIHEAKTHLSALVDRAAAGEPFIIAKAGRPLVTVSSINKPQAHSRTGFLKEQIKIPIDFDRMGNDEILAQFEGVL